jgi:hypothetical protein
MQTATRARSRTWAVTLYRVPINTPRIAMTTSNSMRVMLLSLLLPHPFPCPVRVMRIALLKGMVTFFASQSARPSAKQSDGKDNKQSFLGLDTRYNWGDNSEHFAQ